MSDALQLEEKRFVEEVGSVFEALSLPRMTGRVIGWLLICDPPHQSPDELAEALMASKGSISTTTRLLIRIGMIERLSLPGVRHTYFRIKPGVFHYLLKQEVDLTTTFRQLAERGLELTRNNSPQSRQILIEMHSMYTFFEREFPALLERWEQERHCEESRVKQNVGK
ncbi:GbsR/MarR family transcriptional regulator [Chloroflexota bacterium]